MYDNNLPPNLASDSSFNNESAPKMRPCYMCFGMNLDCITCEGMGEVEMTENEIAEESEDREENKSEL